MSYKKRKEITLSKEHKKNLSLAHKGVKFTEERKEKLRVPHKKGSGIYIRKEIHKKRISEGQKRRVLSGTHNLWKGGITPVNQKIRTSREYKMWRTSVFERDDYTCIWCGSKSAKGKSVHIHADHIKPFAYFPELRFAIDNGRTLCVPCHKTTDTYGGKSLKNNRI